MSAGAVLAGLIVAPVLASYAVEALRGAPRPRPHLPWAPEVPIRFITVDGVRLRYVVHGEGPAVVLLHTMRTQLDMFQHVFPRLARRFRVYALDYPGHGWSEIPDADYTAELFVTAVARFLDELAIEDATLVGESIGGPIALLLAARGHPRVRAVIAVNSYDYDAGRGVRRSSPVARVLVGVSDVPVLGGTVMRLRVYPIVTRILEGGVYRPDSLPPALVRELYQVGNRRGHYRAFMSLLRHAATWERARAEYGRIAVPVLLLYGDHDWSRPDERDATARAIPGARIRIVQGAGHFLSLDAPEEIVGAVEEIAR